MSCFVRIFSIVFLTLQLGCTSVSAMAVDVKRASYDHELSTLSFLSRVGVGRDIVIFIHGTPGNAEAFLEYLSEDWLLQSATMLISIDRPAWGNSTLLESGNEVLTLAQQSQVIGAYFESLKSQYPSSRIIVAGHSLGGSLLARLMADHPQQIDAGLILAGTVDSALAEPRWYHRMAKTGLVQWMIGEELSRSNLEMLSLPEDVSSAESNYTSIKQPLTIIQGRKDKLVSYKNAAYAKAVWPQATVVLLPKSGHFLPWQQQRLIVSHIKQLQITLDSQL